MNKKRSVNYLKDISKRKIIFKKNLLEIFFPRYRPKQVLGGPGKLRLSDFLDFWHYEGGKVVTLTHRPPLPPGVFLVLIFRR